MLDSDSDFRILRALHNLSEGKKRRKKLTRVSRFYTSMSLRVVLSLSTLYFKTVDWSLTTRIKRWERNGVLGWAGVCRGGGGGEEKRAPLKTPSWEAMTQAARKKKSEYLWQESKQWPSGYYLPLSYKRIVGAKAIKLNSCEKTSCILLGLSRSTW